MLAKTKKDNKKIYDIIAFCLDTLEYEDIITYAYHRLLQYILSDW